MISAIKYGAKYTYLSVSVLIIGQMSYIISAYRISAKNPISCIPTYSEYDAASCLKQIVTGETKN